jgi:nucleotide-binding universal stress UspA family protein
VNREDLAMKKLLVPLTGRPLDRRALTTAFLAARRFSAHVAGLAVAPHVEIRNSIESAAIPAALVEQLLRIGQSEQDAVIDGAQALFHERRLAFGLNLTGEAPGASWRRAEGPLAETVAAEARLADLTVLAQASDGSNAMGPTIEAALFQSGRPVLLAPAGEPAAVGLGVALAWDGGAAAARAVACALPFLHRAEKVVILSAQAPGAGDEADPCRLAEYLALHGVAAVIHPFDGAGERTLSRALTRAAADAGCDMMVMGAYGHSRMRERMWGGVTLDILREPPPLTVLTAH